MNPQLSLMLLALFGAFLVAFIEAASMSTTTSSTISSSTTSIAPVSAITAVCPSNSPFCKCNNNNVKLTCEGKNVTELPDLSATQIKWIVLNDTSIKVIKSSYLPSTLEGLILKSNPANLTGFPKATKSPYILPKLKTLIIRKSKVPINLTYITETFRFPALTTLDLSSSQVEVPENLFANSSDLETLVLDQVIISELKPNTLRAFKNLKNLTIHGTLNHFYYFDSLLSNKDKLEYVDLSNNSLVDIPTALRACPNVKTLILDQNDFRSLRNSDFLNKTELILLQINMCNKLSKIDEFTFDNMPNLEVLTMRNNPSLSSISKDAFGPNSTSRSLKLNLMYNNLSTLPSDLFNNVKLASLSLQNNPWNCDCDLVKFKNISLFMNSAVHCTQPEKFKGMEFRNVANSIVCEEESAFKKIVLEVLLVALVLLLLAAAIILQKRYQIGRKLFWRDQFGSIYYTKASFEPSEPHPLT